MNQDNFVSNFTNLARKYTWSYSKNKLLAPALLGTSVVYLNPVTAVTYEQTGKLFPNTKRGTLRAARSIGITQELAMAVYSTSNRGHSQIIRGKLLKAVE